MKGFLRALLFTAIAFVSACAQVPKEAVSLSDLVGKDLVATRTAHTSLVRQYFGAMRENVNAFVDNTYRPFVVSKTIEELDLVNDLQAAAAGSHEDGLDALDLMEIYVEETISQIQGFRAEMLAPINSQETQLLIDLDQMYGAMINANATVTAHLRSITKVHEAQQDALSHLGLDPGLRDKVSGHTAKLSGEINDLLAKARAGDEQLDELPTKLKSVIDKVR